MARYNITLREYVDKLGVDYNTKGYADCIFCGEKKKLKFKFTTNEWVCPYCGGGGVLHLHARYMMGYDSLPSDKAERSKIAKSLNEFMGTADEKPNSPAARKPITREGPKHPVANDAKLNAVYSAMANMAVFQLTPEHRNELIRRGLTGAQIERNGYRTFPFRSYITPEIVSLYNSVSPDLRKGVSSKEAKHIQFGLYVAKALQDMGHDLTGIPGFYKFGKHWCLTYLPGIMIPTRNVHGEIVVWQVRRNIEPKYMTLSCQDKNGGVDDTVSRCHFPLGNDKPSRSAKVIFTEGPLKADVAMALISEPCIFIAIPGITSAREDLVNNCKMLKKRYGITQIYNALDMDRLTNYHVRDGSMVVDTMLAKIGCRVIPMYWGETYAAMQLPLYEAVAKARKVTVPPYDPRQSVYDKLNSVAKALDDAKIHLGRITPTSQHWESATKGIDDYLHSLVAQNRQP